MSLLLESDRLLSSPEVCELSGLTYRQLDHWCRRGLIAPEVAADGSGTHRRWHPRVLIEIARLAAAIKACPLKHGAGR